MQERDHYKISPTHVVKIAKIGKRMQTNRLKTQIQSVKADLPLPCISSRSVTKRPGFTGK
uniref:ATP phosphoribosyltransferase n=1 Tax=Rhizophora mucronata TaxID=61149 RepID=A0A2P2K706_RHIMU